MNCFNISKVPIALSKTTFFLHFLSNNNEDCDKYKNHLWREYK